MFIHGKTELLVLRCMRMFKKKRTCPPRDYSLPIVQECHIVGKRVCSVYPPWTQRVGEVTLLRVRGWGDLIPTKGQKTVVLYVPVLRIRDAYKFFPSWIPDPGSQSASKRCKYFNPKNCFYALGNMIRVVHPWSGFVTHPGSRAQKGSGSRIRIRNTAMYYTVISLLRSQGTSGCCLMMRQPENLPHPFPPPPNKRVGGMC